MNNLGRFVVFIDNTNIFRSLSSVREGYRIDYKKLFPKLEGLGGPNDTMWDAHFFGAVQPGDAGKDSQSDFYEWLQRSCNCTVHVKELHSSQVKCSKCGEERTVFSEKGLDLRFVLTVMGLLRQAVFDTAVFVTGNGAFEDLVYEVVTTGRKVVVVAFKDSLSSKLVKATNLPPVYLDDWVEEIAFAKETN